MAIILRKDARPSSPSNRQPGVVEFSFPDMRGRAEDYLQTVRQEAAKIVQQAHQQAEQIRKQAEIAGRKAAEAAAERVLDEKISRRMDTLVPALEEMTKQINNARGELQHYWEQSAVRIATAIAARIIRREIERQPEIALDVIADTLRLAAGAEELTVEVNPTDYENLGPQIRRLGETLCQLAPSAIVPVPSISPGGCRVLTKLGEIDQRIESQLLRIEQDLE